MLDVAKIGRIARHTVKLRSSELISLAREWLGYLSNCEGYR
jgi:hypothetical protein